MSRLKQVTDAWPVLVVAGGMMVALLTVYAKGFVGDVVEEDLGKVQVIIDMNKEITANTENIEDHDDDVDELKDEIRALGVKIDRLIEIMLTE